MVNPSVSLLEKLFDYEKELIDVLMQPSGVKKWNEFISCASHSSSLIKRPYSLCLFLTHSCVVGSIRFPYRFHPFLESILMGRL